MQDEPYIAENHLLAYFETNDLCNLYQINNKCHAYLRPDHEYCPQYASVFAQYKPNVFDESRDWMQEIQETQEKTESFFKIMQKATDLMKKSKLSENKE